MESLAEQARNLRHMRLAERIAQDEPFTPDQRRKETIARLTQMLIDDDRFPSFGERLNEAGRRALNEDDPEKAKELAADLHLSVPFVLEMFTSWTLGYHAGRKPSFPGATYEPRITGTNGTGVSPTSPGKARDILRKAPEYCERLTKDVQVSCLRTMAAHPVVAMGLAICYVQECLEVLREDRKLLRKLYGMPVRSNRQLTVSDHDLRTFIEVHIVGTPTCNSTVWRPYERKDDTVLKDRRLETPAIQRATKAVTRVKRIFGIERRRYRRADDRSAHESPTETASELRRREVSLLDWRSDYPVDQAHG